jgi:type I restriction enzyme, S subunit
MLITETSKSQQTSSKNGDAKLVSSDKHKASGFSFLKKTHLRKITNWSFGYLIQNQVLFSDSFQQVKIGTFLTRSKNAIKIQDNETYRRVTIKLYGNGVKIRDEVEGKEIGTKSQFLVSERQFILSRIDARNGAFAIATKEIDGAIVTNDFPVYDIDQNLINPNYFSLLISTKRFASYFQGLSSGTTNRQRMNETDFLEMEIPLPSIATQEKLVADYNAQMLQAAQFEATAKDLEKKIETYLLKELGIEIQQTEKKDWQGFSFLQPANLKELSRWDTWALGEDFNSSRYKNLTLRDVTVGEPQYGANSKAIKKVSDCRYIRITDINEDGSLNDEIVSAEKCESKYLLQENDLLIARSGATVGKTFLYNENFGKAIYAGYLVRYKIYVEIIQPEYLLMFTKSSIFKHWIKSNQRISAQPNINGQEFLNSIVILPPLKIQNKIVNHINSLKAKIKVLKTETENLRSKAKGDFESELFEM